MYQSIKHREALEWEADASLTKNDCSFAGLMKMSGGMVRPFGGSTNEPRAGGLETFLPTACAWLYWRYGVDGDLLV
jgi:hypothetical protein